jgi:hypothetical protein
MGTLIASFALFVVAAGTAVLLFLRIQKRKNS